MTILLATIAGALGASARLLLSGAIARQSSSRFPIGTAVVNLIGAFALGLIIGAGDGSAGWMAAAAFTGGLTTFSTWMIETTALGLAPRPSPLAILNVVAVTVAGVALAALGYGLVA